MLVGIILMKSRLNPEKLNFFFMRIILIFMAFSIVMDFFWLIFYTNVNISYFFYLKLSNRIGKMTMIIAKIV